MADKLVIVMVGLPARGKTFTARKIARYLSWRGYRTQVFNVGNYRRERIGAATPHAFFRADNSEGLLTRHQLAMAALSDLLGWLKEAGDVALYDATNSTRARREEVHRRCRLEGHRVIFVESICDDPDILETNIRETKLRAPDYLGVSPEEAVADFRARIAHYESVYEPLVEPHYSFLQIINAGERIVAQRLEGYVSSLLAGFVMNLHITPRPIYITRHGQSLYNVSNRLGGDSSLSDWGRGYAQSLAAFFRERELRPSVWTSTLQRTLQTSEPMGGPNLSLKALDEIDAGVCDGLTYQEVERQMPEEFAARRADKLRYRYPRGESYEDVIRRLNPVITDLERQRSPVLIIAHQAVLRALYGYLVGLPREDCPHLAMPLHTVIELLPRAYGCRERRYPLQVSPQSGV